MQGSGYLAKISFPPLPGWLFSGGTGARYVDSNLRGQQSGYEPTHLAPVQSTYLDWLSCPLVRVSTSIQPRGQDRSLSCLLVRVNVDTRYGDSNQRTAVWLLLSCRRNRPIWLLSSRRTGQEPDTSTRTCEKGGKAASFIRKHNQ